MFFATVLFYCSSPHRPICNNTHTRLTALCPGLPGWAGTRKVTPVWIFWSKRQWVAVASTAPCTKVQVCTLLQTDNHASTPPLSFLQARCPSCCPTNSVKALKATTENNQRKIQLKQSKVKYKLCECVCFSMHIARFYLLFSAHGQLSVLCSLAVQLSMNCYCLWLLERNKINENSSLQSNLPQRYGNSHATWYHTV